MNEFRGLGLRGLGALGFRGFEVRGSRSWTSLALCLLKVETIKRVSISSPSAAEGPMPCIG